ncbi:DUF6886 family protein [Nocardioides sp. Soil805]|uniref:DUF6886 family protein n=1 Tax=Nocardioides sp. Soil805 TaxID=1736416 RepID=UPI0007027B26|nr:DUF6886 family protein [Nocardioides sp. Soil805]KRF36212.1 hypothetical protein ASG94_01655 [Nocardioides sp. Soil805]
MLPAPGELLHFSEDAEITDFVPHVAATARQSEAYVWAVDALNAPCYWFPRQCPRVCAWGPDGVRVHAVEEAWLPAMAEVPLHAYRFAARDFEPFGDRPHAFVATTPVTPLGPPVRVADTRGLHEQHGIELRAVPDLERHFDTVRADGWDFSAIRMRNVGRGPAAFGH